MSSDIENWTDEQLEDLKGFFKWSSETDERAHTREMDAQTLAEIEAEQESRKQSA